MAVVFAALFASCGPVRVDDVDDLPAIRPSYELDGIGAAVAELLAGVEVVGCPHGGDVVIDSHFGIPDALVPWYGRRADGGNESVDGKRARPRAAQTVIAGRDDSRAGVEYSAQDERVVRSHRVEGSLHRGEDGRGVGLFRGRRRLAVGVGRREDSSGEEGEREEVPGRHRSRELVKGDGFRPMIRRRRHEWQGEGVSPPPSSFQRPRSAVIPASAKRLFQRPPKCCHSSVPQTLSSQCTPGAVIPGKTGTHFSTPCAIRAVGSTSTGGHSGTAVSIAK